MCRAQKDAQCLIDLHEMVTGRTHEFICHCIVLPHSCPSFSGTLQKQMKPQPHWPLGRASEMAVTVVVKATAMFLTRDL